MNQSLKLFLESQRQNKNFDESLLLQLVEDTDAETVLQILIRFQQTLMESIQTIEDGLRQDSKFVAAGKAAHKIAGTAALVGYKNLGDTARDLSHRLAKSENPNSFRDELQLFLNSTNQVKDAISKSFPNDLDL